MDQIWSRLRREQHPKLEEVNLPLLVQKHNTIEPHLQHIVNILQTDGEVILNWTKLFNGLELKSKDFVKFDRQVKNGTVVYDDLFLTMLKKWLSAKGYNATPEVLRQVLENNEFQFVADKLRDEIILPRSTHRTKIWFEVPRATDNFSGRRKELKQLEELFNSKKSLLVGTTTGMGGVGKSELVKNFAKELSEQRSVDCIWLNGESKESLKNSIKRLENLLKPPKPGKSKKSLTTTDGLFTHIISTIKENTRILVIIDNVDEANEDVRKIILKMPEGRCVFLVTSRNVKVLNIAGTIIRLKTFEEVDSVNFLKKSGINERDDEIKKLCTLLGNFPLALQQAAAYIKEQKIINGKGAFYQISDYLEIYESQKSSLLDYKLDSIETEYQLTTLITWNISFEKIKRDDEFGGLATQLLNTIAYFKPDGIQEEFLNIYRKDFKEAIPLLKTYSLVIGEGSVISVHRLVQQVIQLNLSSENLESQNLTEILTAIQSVLEKSTRYFGLSGVFYVNGHNCDNANEKSLLDHAYKGIGHIVSVWKYTAKHPQLLRKFWNVFLDTVNQLPYLNKIPDTINLCHVILGELNKNFRANEELILRLKSELAYAKCSCYMDSHNNEIELRAVYDKQTSILGVEDESTLTTAHYIAQIHWNEFSDEINKKDVQWCRKIVELKTNVFKSFHKSTLATKLLLAKHIGYNNESANLYEECYNWQADNVGLDRPDTQEVLECYVYCLIHINKYEQAKRVLEHILQQNLTRYNYWANLKLSLVLFCLGETEEAFSVLRQAIRSEYNDNGVSQFDSKVTEYKRADSLLEAKNYYGALQIYNKIQIYAIDGEWWPVDVEYKKSQCLIGLQQFKKAKEILNTVTMCTPWLNNNCKQMIKIKKSRDDMKNQIRRSRRSRCRCWPFISRRREVQNVFP